MTAAASRTYLPLAQSPLLTERTTSADTDLAVRLAEQAALEPATVRSLLAVTDPATAERITIALEARTDLPPSSLALLVARRPQAKDATARLRKLLFPTGTGACHRFARAIAALAHQPETIDGPYLNSARFAKSAVAADPEALQELLAAVLTAPMLNGPTDAALATLLAARAVAPASAFDQAASAARERTRRHRIGAELTARRDETISAISAHTGGLTLAATLWFDALKNAADTPENAGRALAIAHLAAPTLAASGDLDCHWPAVQARWRHVTAASHTSRAHPPVWEEAWTAATATADGSTWDPSQRALVAGYDLLADHVRTHHEHGTLPTPDQCWASDPAGRVLLHTVADHLTGHLGHSPLPHFDDTLLITFIRAHAKNRRDKIPGALHIHGLIAALKAARSKTLLLTRPTAPDLGIVIPMRSEVHRLAPPAPDTTGGQDALTTKTDQLGWLLDARPEARAHLLLVDEDPDGSSAHAARQVLGHHPQIRYTVATRTDDTSTKGGAVLWGLAQLHAAGHTTLAYTDLDLTYPLDQLGLHLAALDRPNVGAAIGSRRQPDSHGYYPPSGPTPVTLLYQQAVTELLALDVTDPQAGFKAFTPAVLATALPHVADQSLSFDTELLAAIQHTSHTVAEVGVAALHHYVDGQVGAPRDYDAMLNSVYQQALRHGPDPASRPTPFWDHIQETGSLAAAATAKTAPIALTMTHLPR
ncbi:hypothetical protein [Streptomyces sp. AK02-01A]|uniref:hypothetical protein n=1 Tax=Streptomyces sp. AK02-01A TaxID=3028648 RepID=UPI0029A15BCD|nr:hypothetical protein [Streptomyces sp. AK02-01A]MDX3855782.1 hypothetical protein [Streptomyces sp. AK02-01A]